MDARLAEGIASGSCDRAPSRRRTRFGGQLAIAMPIACCDFVLPARLRLHDRRDMLR